MRRLSVLGIITCLLFLGCNSEPKQGFVSSAMIESDLWKVSPIVSGQLLSVHVREGDSVQVGQLLAIVDSSSLALKVDEISASLRELQANVNARSADGVTLQETRAGIEREYARMTKMVTDGTAPAQKKDELETQMKTSQAQIQSTKMAVEAMRAKAFVLHAQEASLRDQIQKCRISSPATGRIMTRYRNAGEAALQGRPIVEIGRMDSMWADFFIPQPELGRFRLGQKLRLRIDNATNPLWVDAKLSWIASEAEFTPKGVQTREARNELVFRARTLAGNDKGILKRGMPVEVYEP